jgi:YVTN family beta-propeller protein
MKKALPVLTLATTIGIGCGGTEMAGAPMTGGASDLVERAYVISRDHEELTVFNLKSREIVGRVATGGVTNHMAELSADFAKIYVTSSDSNELIVVDARSLTVTKKVPLGKHPTHLTLAPGGKLLAIMVEDDNAITFVDTDKDEVKTSLPGFYTPHFMRFSRDGKTGFVANVGAYHLTRIDMTTLTIVDHIALGGHAGPPSATPARDEGGFADAQIDREGRLYAAHHATGRVLVYDTVANRPLPELQVGLGPWVVFAEHPFANVPLRHLVSSFMDQTVSLIDTKAHNVAATLPGDEEAYGVNFSSQAPGRAFVMNRVRQDVAIVDTAKGEIAARIAVGGNTETASTTADGSAIVAAVSGADRVVFIDPVTGSIAKAFEGIGHYPWSVTIPNGQNYCH